MTSPARPNRRPGPALLLALVALALPLALILGRLRTQAPDALLAQDRPAQSDEAPLLVFMSWDGLPAWMLDRSLEAGQLPNVQRLIDAGAKADYSVGNWASKTAAGHAAVFTGAFGDVNGITSNGVPPMPSRAHDIDAWGPSGFSADSLWAEPIWVSAAKQGRKVVSVSATQSQPFAMHTDASFVSSQGLPGFGAPAENLWMVDGYGARILAGPAVYRAADTESGLRRTDEGSSEWVNLPAGGPYDEFALVIEATRLEGLLYGQGEDRRLVLAAGKDYEARLAELAAAPPSPTGTEHFSPAIQIQVEGGRALTHFRLYEAPDDGSDLLLWRSYGSDIARAMLHPEGAADLEAAAGAFTGNSGMDGLGTTLPEGGDGTAEARYIETSFLVSDWFRRATVWAIQQGMGEVYLTYSPFPDEAHHSWYGLLDEGSRAHDPALAAALWPLEDAMLANLDAFLGEVIDALEATGRPWNLALFTDHGFMGVDKTFYPNRVLRQAGLLAAEGGDIDPSGTQAMYMPQNGAYVRINAVADSQAHAGFASGIVTDDQWEAVADQVTDALLSARDPETGEVIVTGVLRAADMRGLGIGGPHGGDLYLDLAEGYTISSSFGEGPVAVARDPYDSGDHVMFTYRSSLQGMAVFGGDQIADIGRLHPIRSIDIAPTMARAVGLQPPAQSQGQVLGALLETDLPPRIWEGFLPWLDRGADGAAATGR